MNAINFGGAHTVRAFDEDIFGLFRIFDEMRVEAVQMLRDAVAALRAHDLQAAEAIVARDRALDDLQASLEGDVVRVLARRAPVADDLRMIVTLIKIASILERVGDHAKNIAKRIASVPPAGLEEEIGLVEHMAEIAERQITLGAAAFLERAATVADQIEELDEELDAAFDSFTDRIVEQIAENERDVAAGMHLLFIGKQIERVGDHGCNIANAARYIATGEHPHSPAADEDLLPA